MNPISDDDLKNLSDIAVPATLLESILARLEAEGLVGAQPAETPAGLLARTLERLESEGLVAPEGFTARSTHPWWRRVGAAAALLLATTIGAAAGWLLRGERVVEKLLVREVPVEKVVPVVVEKQVEVPKEVVRARLVEKVVERVIEKPVEPERLVLTAVSGVDEWSFAAGAWRPLAPGASIVPGAVLRGSTHGARIALGGEPRRFEGGLYVLTAAKTVEPVPGMESPARPGVPRPLTPQARDGEDLDETVAGLLREWSTGSREDRASAQHELAQLWKVLGDPGAGMPREILAFARPPEDDSEPPTTARGWTEWWRRVRPGRPLPREKL